MSNLNIHILNNFYSSVALLNINTTQIMPKEIAFTNNHLFSINGFFLLVMVGIISVLLILNIFKSLFKKDIVYPLISAAAISALLALIADIFKLSNFFQIFSLDNYYEEKFSFIFIYSGFYFITQLGQHLFKGGKIFYFDRIKQKYFIIISIISLFAMFIIPFKASLVLFIASTFFLLTITMIRSFKLSTLKVKAWPIYMLSTAILGLIPILILFKHLTSIPINFTISLLFSIPLLLLTITIEYKYLLENQAEEIIWDAIKKSEFKLKSIFERATEGIFQASAGGRIITANPSLAKIFGYDSVEDLIKSITHAATELIVDPEKRVEFINKMQDEQRVDNFKVNAYHKSGKIIAISINAHSEYDNEIDNYYYEGYIEELTERETSEANLKKSENKYRFLYESMMDGYASIDMDGKIIEFNNAFQKMIEYPPDKIYQLSYEDLTPEKWHETEKRILEHEVMQKGFSKIYEKEYIKCDGSIFPVELRTYLKNDKSGNAIGMWAIVKDISERKRLEDMWKKYEAIVSTSQEFMTLINCNYIYEAVNDSFCIAHEKRREDIIGKHLTYIWGSETFEKEIKPNIDKCLTGYPVMKQKNFQFGILGNRYLDVGYYPFYDKHDCVSHVIVITHDITERVNAELELKKSKEELEQRVNERTKELSVTNDILKSEILIREQAEVELRNSEEKYRQLIETMTDGLIVINEKGIITYTNSKMHEMTGYTADELLGNSIFEYLDKNNKPVLTEQLQLRKNGIHEPYEIDWVCKNGTIIQTMVSPQIICDENSSFIGSFGVVTDISERKKNEIDLKSAKEDAESANRAKSVFLANISHEIRTPMNAILGFSELLESIVKNKQHKQYLSTIMRSGKTLLELINDVLDLSKIEAGKLTLEYSNVNMHKVLNEIKQMFSQKLKEKNLSFNIEIDSNLPPYLHLDELRIRQVFLNLIGNAVKFTPSGYVKVTVAGIPENGNDKIISLGIAIEDSGIGIKEDQQKLIFEAFRQQDGQSPSQYGGTGLGLTITKRIVELMGGIISVESEKEKGSKFTIVINHVEVLTNEKQNDVKHEINPSDVIFEEAVILIVDDLESNRVLLKGFLKNYGFTIYEAANGEDAIKSAKKYKPDLILMDIKMPELDGDEALKIIRNDETIKSIPAIAITASVLKYSHEKDLSGYNGYLLKPISKRDLVNEIIRFIPSKISEPKKPLKEFSLTLKEIPDHIISDIPQILSILENKLYTQWDLVQKRFIFNEIIEFAEKVKDLGEKYKFEIIIGWSENLIENAKSFEMENTPTLLKNYKKLIKIIKKAYKKHTTN